MAMAESQGRARLLTDELVQHIYSEKFRKVITPKEVIKGGSLGQGTAVNGEFDLDLVIITEDFTLQHIGYPPNYQPWLGKVEKYFQTELYSVCTGMKNSGRALIFRYKDEIDVNLLISPYIADPIELYEFLEKIPPEYHSSFTVCANKWQVAFLSKQPNEVKDLIRKAKMWRNSIPEWVDRRKRPKSYLITLLVLAAYERAKASYGSTHATVVTRTLKEMVQNHKFLDVTWNERYRATGSSGGRGISVPDHCKAAPRILDPANPFHNLYIDGVSKDPGSQWQTIAYNIRTIDLNAPMGIEKSS